MAKPQIILNAGAAAIAMAIAYRLANLMLDSVLPKKTQEEGRRGGTRGRARDDIVRDVFAAKMCEQATSTRRGCCWPWRRSAGSSSSPFLLGSTRSIMRLAMR